MPRVSTIRLLLCSTVALISVGVVQPSAACTIPVFRYALERWDLAVYELVVFHRDELPTNQRVILDAWQGKANLVVHTVDLDGSMNPKMKALWERQGNGLPLPWAVLRRPGAGAKSPPVWSGRLDATSLRTHIDSPARRSIVSALSGGDSSVFVLLLSGDRPADEAAADLLRRQLAKLEHLVRLPEQRGEGPRIRLALPLKVAFSVLPLKRDEAGEEGLVKLLLESEDGLGRISGPIVFPVFGRGRVLGSLFGEDLNPENLVAVVGFLCGECSCELKDQNPGSDLLIAADWGAIFSRIGPASNDGFETPMGLSRFAARAKPISGPLAVAPAVSKPGGEVHVAVSSYPPESESVFPGSGDIEPAADVTAAPHRRWIFGATIVAAILVLATGVWLYHSLRRRPRQ